MGECNMQVIDEDSDQREFKLGNVGQRILNMFDELKPQQQKMSKYVPKP